MDDKKYVLIKLAEASLELSEKIDTLVDEYLTSVSNKISRCSDSSVMTEWQLAKGSVLCTLKDYYSALLISFQADAGRNSARELFERHMNDLDQRLGQEAVSFNNGGELVKDIVHLGNKVLNEKIECEIVELKGVHI